MPGNASLLMFCSSLSNLLICVVQMLPTSRLPLHVLLSSRTRTSKRLYSPNIHTSIPRKPLLMLKSMPYSTSKPAEESIDPHKMSFIKLVASLLPPLKAFTSFAALEVAVWVYLIATVYSYNQVISLLTMHYSLLS